MIRLNVHEAKTHLSRYLARLGGGELILLCKRNVPIAEIRPVRQPRTERRPVGLAKDRFEVPARSKTMAAACEVPDMVKYLASSWNSGCSSAIVLLTQGQGAEFSAASLRGWGDLSSQGNLSGRGVAALTPAPLRVDGTPTAYRSAARPP